MAGFLFFISGDQRPPTAERIAAWGLGYAFTSPSIDHRPVMGSSPSGKNGGVICEGPRHKGKSIGYYPTEQTWTKLPPVEGRPEIHLGYWNDAPPRPIDLERPEMLTSEVAYLAGEGCRWRIPTLTEFDEAGHGECQLPSLERLKDGEYAFELLPPMARLWEIVHPVALGLCGFAPPRPAEEVKAAAIELLAANYVISRAELAILGALARDRRYEWIVRYSCQANALMEAIAALNDPEKKTDSTRVDGT